MLPLGYPHDCVPLITCTSPSSSFRDLDTEGRFNNQLASFMANFIGTPCMLYGIEYIIDNAAGAFHRLYSAVYLDVSIDGQEPTRLEIEVSHRLFPKTAENFRVLCTGEAGASKEGCTKKLCYKGEMPCCYLTHQKANWWSI